MHSPVRAIANRQDLVCSTADYNGGESSEHGICNPRHLSSRTRRTSWQAGKYWQCTVAASNADRVSTDKQFRRSCRSATQLKICQTCARQIGDLYGAVRTGSQRASSCPVDSTNVTGVDVACTGNGPGNADTASKRRRIERCQTMCTARHSRVTSCRTGNCLSKRASLRKATGQTDRFAVDRSYDTGRLCTSQISSACSGGRRTGNRLLDCSDILALKRAF